MPPQQRNIIDDERTGRVEAVGAPGADAQFVCCCLRPARWSSACPGTRGFQPRVFERCARLRPISLRKSAGGREEQGGKDESAEPNRDDSDASPSISDRWPVGVERNGATGGDSAAPTGHQRTNRSAQRLRPSLGSLRDYRRLPAACFRQAVSLEGRRRPGIYRKNAGVIVLVRVGGVPIPRGSFATGNRYVCRVHRRSRKRTGSSTGLSGRASIASPYSRRTWTCRHSVFQGHSRGLNPDTCTRARGGGVLRAASEPGRGLPRSHCAVHWSSPIRLRSRLRGDRHPGAAVARRLGSVALTRLLLILERIELAGDLPIDTGRENGRGGRKCRRHRRDCLDRWCVHSGCVDGCDAAEGNRTQAHRAHRRRPVGEVRWRPSAAQLGRSPVAAACHGDGRVSKLWFGRCPPTRAAAEGRGACQQPVARELRISVKLNDDSGDR